MPLSDDVIGNAVDRYTRERDRYVKLAERVADICRSDIVEENAIRAQVTSRAKSAKSLDGKLRRPATSDGQPMQSVEDVFSRIGDLAGVRVATYRAEDQELVVKEIEKRFLGPAGAPVGVDRKDRLRQSGSSYYRAIHCQVFLLGDELVGTYENLKDVGCEIQVCSMMAHVWNEIEHDIGYKPEGSGPLQNEARMLAALGHLTRSGDEIISQLLDATLSRLQEQTGDFQDVFDFAARLRTVFSGANLSINAGQLFEEIKLLRLDSPEKLRLAIGADRFTPEAAKVSLNAFNGFLRTNDREGYELDENSSDLLLALLFDKYAGQIEANHLAGRGRGRPPRIRSLATRYLEYMSLSAAAG
jgi:ppGpp synthetase/RelA/SpoT-type nucleotidyltranferase